MKRRMTIAIGAGLLAASALLSGAAMQQDENPLAKTAQSIDIMRRVIVKSINLELAEYTGANEKGGNERTTAAASAPTFVTTTGYQSYSYVTSGGTFASFASDSRGHVVPGHGAMFSLSVVVPSKAEDAKPKEVPEAGEGDDLWSQAEREASGRGDTLFVQAIVTYNSTPAKVITRDEKAVERAIRAVVEAVGRHGSKIEGLGDDDSIIVAMNVRGGAVQVEGDSDGNVTMFYSAMGAFSTADDREERIVIEVTMEDIARYASRRLDLDGLREKARVTRY